MVRDAASTALGFTDLQGRLKTLHRTDANATSPAYFDGSSVAGYTAVEDSDLKLIPDTDPGAREVAGTELYFCDIYTPDDERFDRSPRTVLQHVLDDLPYDVKVGAEPEFFLLDEEREPVDDADYFDPAFFNDPLPRITAYLEDAGIPVSGFHSEVAASQWEVKADYTDKSVVEAADDIVLCKHLVQEAAAEEHGLEATFMPKLNEENGSGMHLHFSLWEDGENLFAAGDGELSEAAYQFAAGIIDHADALSAVVSPTVNSYKRLVPGKEAPTKKGMGPRNRSALIRFPAFDGSGAARIEYRAPDPSANPYLAFAAVLAAGRDGIERGLDDVEISGANLYESDEAETLPASLDEALEALERDGVVRDALGAAAEPYIALKHEEVAAYEAFCEKEGVEKPWQDVTDFDWEWYASI